MSLMCCWLVSEQVYRLASACATLGILRRALGHGLDVDHRGDVVAAVADEDADARLLVGDVAFPRVLVALDHGAAHGGQFSMAQAAAPEAWATDSGMSLGSWKAPAT